MRREEREIWEREGGVRETGKERRRRERRGREIHDTVVVIFFLTIWLQILIHFICSVVRVAGLYTLNLSKRTREES